MSVPWTSQRVLSLSPDASSTKRGQALAQLSKWPSLAQSGQAVWGECQGSGKKPYRTAGDLGDILGDISSEPAFRCNCPSRKFPCKHALGLLLLWTKQTAFAVEPPPEWVKEWLDKRANTKQKKPPSPQKDTTDLATNTQAQAQSTQQAQQRTEKRLEKRAEKVSEGLVDLNQWMCDTMRSGLADLASQPYQFWDQTASRLIDAQAPGLARRVRALAGIPHSGKGWPERMLKALGSLYLLGQGYSQRATLSPMMQAEILKQIGFPQNKEDLHRRADAGDPLVHSLSDTWHVLGKVVTEEETLKIQRVWLWGINSQKAALVLSFTHGRRQPLDTSLVPGASFEGKLLFYPGTGVQRALVVNRLESNNVGATNSSRLGLGVVNIEAAIATYTHALSENPWLAEFPMVLSQVWPRYQAGRWYLQDADKQQLPISPSFEAGWEMLAMSGGQPLCLFGEWDGELFSPLSAWSEQREKGSEKTFVMLEGNA